ncbi:coenzyme F420-0:L-glutamate ligase [Labrenzia sp. DG1229]|uniref:coenzyme F420-0:L-glutamate ligase n=1 Tax=Labrenzia sp. DG1229 TaxID=681847 RepID=UPI00048D7E94|nr:coenzyme F420-0:L-glutamate ligase [Labrenzia sp. DG1229]
MVSLQTINSIPLITSDADLAAEIWDAAGKTQVSFKDGDIVVVAQKVVSKAEGCYCRLGRTEISERAVQTARETGKTPEFVEAVLSESVEVVRSVPGVLIVEHRLGHITANAGIDRSNIDAAVGDEDVVLLLPEDPDRSAMLLRERLEAYSGRRIGVIIADSCGRPWRLGTVGTAIGIAGPPALVKKRGALDLFGRPLHNTEICFSDAVAAAAVLIMGEADEGTPVVVARGLDWRDTEQTAKTILRPRSEDLFR